MTITTRHAGLLGMLPTSPEAMFAKPESSGKSKKPSKGRR